MADTDLRLCRFFGLSDGYWLRAQIAYDLELERRRMEPELEKIRPLAIAAESVLHPRATGEVAPFEASGLN